MAVFLLLAILLIIYLFKPNSEWIREGLKYVGKKAIRKVIIFICVLIPFIAFFSYDIYKDPYLSIGGPFSSESEESYSVYDSSEDKYSAEEDNSVTGKLEFLSNQGKYIAGEPGFYYFEVEFLKENNDILIRETTPESPEERGVFTEVKNNVVTYKLQEGEIKLDLTRIRGNSNAPLVVDYNGTQKELHAVLGEEPIIVEERIYYNGDSIRVYKVLDHDENDDYDVAEDELVDSDGTIRKVYGYIDEDDVFASPIPEVVLGKKYKVNSDEYFEIEIYLRKHVQYGDRFALNLHHDQAIAGNYSELQGKSGNTLTFYDFDDDKIVFVDITNVNGTPHDSLTVKYDGKQFILYPYE
jgi:hypothetical protein